jgi:hypothetical protein
MIERPYWLSRIHAAWKKRPIVWLAGVRRVGKTTLARMLPDTVYLNCDLPSDARRLDDPEMFFRARSKTAVIVLDEVHRLPDPSQVLKIASDAYPGLRILATGSSTLAATRKFRDTLTGRKYILHLPPVLWSECEDNFGIVDLDHRLHHGGLPEFLLSSEKDESLFSEWMDSFYARDIQELFAVEVDFVVRRGREVDAVECKVNPDRFDPASLAVFREAYPRGRNFVVCPGIRDAYDRRFGGLMVRVVGKRDLGREKDHRP